MEYTPKLLEPQFIDHKQTNLHVFILEYVILVLLMFPYSKDHSEEIPRL